ncbi:Six-hairpin glycosidase-like protein [Clohesyomyces aquaticus]|uniref:Six-hairpin glycosidase-like protein n=1 Tax=Clohesyomyces aquaticus TaxID=1231657 RepID=A0A1Y1YXU6_9PLEO|nr:Six-hairpin glycosidase-like protein [Clohesyomyces aquaticus]
MEVLGLYSVLWGVLSSASFGAAALTAPIATVDYGIEVAGIPFFSVSVIEPTHQSIQVEIRYSEAYAPLAHPLADGPYTFSVSLANGFRVETFNVSGSGRFASPLMQGGQRWQSIRLLNEGNASISFDQVGFEATVDSYDVTDMPAGFQCDDEKLNAIWSLGAAAVAIACVEKGSQPAVWGVDPVKGVLLRSQKPAVWAHGFGFANYTMEFDTIIERGGVWWTLAMPSGGYGSYLQLRLVSDLPTASTFVNVNRTLAPPNSILVSYGTDFVNQTTLESWYIDTFPIPSPTVMDPSGRLVVSLNDQEAFDISMSDYYTGGSAVSFIGSFGVGAWQDEVAYVKNLSVTDSTNGSSLYRHPLITDDVLVDFETQSNIKSVCLDGPKRDSLVWLGDLYHTVRVVGSNTSQTSNYGMLAINAPMGYEPETSAPLGPAGGLEDYQLLGASSMFSYIRHTNDLDFLRTTWPLWRKQLGWLESRINASDSVLREFSELAAAIDDGATASHCTTLANSLVKSIQEKLWNGELGVFSAAVNDRSNFSVPAIAFCITSGVATTQQATRSIAALRSQLVLGVGYKDGTKVDAQDPATMISPNTNGFLLDALFRAGAYSTGHDLLRSLWGAMVHDPETSSGASWEYVLPDEQPGLGPFTSLAHPWDGAPTYVLTEWAAGLQPAPGPAGFGYRAWAVRPQAGLAMGLKRAEDRVQTSSGPLCVRWEIVGGRDEMRVVVEAPANSTGTFVLGAIEKVLGGKDRYEFNITIE